MSENEENPPARKEPYAVIVPNEADLTAPVAAATELSKIYIFAQNKVAQLEECSWIEQVPIAEGSEETRPVVHDHPKLTWWFDQSRKILSDAAKINIQSEIKAVDQKIRLLDIFLNSDAVPKKMRDELAILAMKERIGAEKK